MVVKTAVSEEEIEQIERFANEWIEADDVDVISVETLLLPGVEQSQNTEQAVMADESWKAVFAKTPQWLQVVRVWYRTSA